MKGYFNEFWRGRGGIYKNPVKGAAVFSTTITEEKYDKKENKRSKFIRYCNYSRENNARETTHDSNRF